MFTRTKASSSYELHFSSFWMIVDKRGEENGLRFQDLPLKILGAERKSPKSMCEDLYLFLVSFCNLGQTSFCDRSDRSSVPSEL
jgi:hypothetical protein